MTDFENLAEYHGNFERKLTQLIVTKEGNKYLYGHSLTTQGQYSLRARNNVQSVKQIRSAILKDCKTTFMTRLHQHEVSLRIKYTLANNWAALKMTKTIEYVLEEYGKEEIKYLCFVFEEEFNVVWTELKHFKLYILSNFSLESCPTNVQSHCMILLNLLRQDANTYQTLNKLYNHILSLSNNAMYLERYNSKAQIVCGGNKYRNSLTNLLLSDIVSICENAPSLMKYDIRPAALEFAYHSIRQKIDVKKAMNQAWYKGIFETDKKRKNQSLDKRIQRFLSVNSTENDESS